MKTTMIYNPYPQIQLPFGNDNKLFLDLFESIMRVDKRYIRYKVQSSEKKFGYQPHLERVFAYELYRQWGNTIESKGYSLVLNAEIQKTINCGEITYIDSSDGNKLEQITLYPDLVLHHSQEDDESQSMICEIKREHKLTNAQIFSDLYKICKYLSEDVLKNSKPFQYGVFILVGESLSFMEDNLQNRPNIIVSGKKKKFEDSLSNDEKELFKKIVCISYDGTILEYELLSELIKQNVQENKKK